MTDSLEARVAELEVLTQALLKMIENLTDTARNHTESIKLIGRGATLASELDAGKRLADLAFAVASGKPIASLE